MKNTGATVPDSRLSTVVPAVRPRPIGKSAAVIQITPAAGRENITMIATMTNGVTRSVSRPRTAYRRPRRKLEFNAARWDGTVEALAIGSAPDSRIIAGNSTPSARV